VALPAVTVSTVVMGNEMVDFDVDQIGVPVLVKVSYFPNWQVAGGTGPYRIAPNLMVVIPTSKHVTMEFGRSTEDYLAYLLSFIGLILLFVFGRYIPITYRSADPFDPYPAPGPQWSPSNAAPQPPAGPASEQSADEPGIDQPDVSPFERPAGELRTEMVDAPTPDDSPPRR
jgi:hypothetical protein